MSFSGKREFRGYGRRRFRRRRRVCEILISKGVLSGIMENAAVSWRMPRSPPRSPKSEIPEWMKSHPFLSASDEMAVRRWRKH